MHYAMGAASGDVRRKESCRTLCNQSLPGMTNVRFIAAYPDPESALEGFMTDAPDLVLMDIGGETLRLHRSVLAACVIAEVYDSSCLWQASVSLLL